MYIPLVWQWTPRSMSLHVEYVDDIVPTGANLLDVPRANRVAARVTLTATQIVPEPGTIVLTASGLAVLAGIAYRRRRS